MKKASFTILLFLLSFNCFCTEQQCDILIHGNDTIYLKSFPLVKLKLKINPFIYGNNDFPNTHCWRGYIAIWKIRNDSLFLTKIIPCYSKLDSICKEKNIFDYFNENNANYYSVDKMIFASWYTADLIKNDSDPKGGTVPRGFKKKEPKIYLCEKWNIKQKKILIHIEQGVITKNNFNVP